MALFKGFLFPGVFPYGLFIKSHRAHTVSRAPEMLRHHLLVTQNLWVNSPCTLVLDKPYRKGDTMLRGMLAHMWFRHQVPFRQLDPSLPAYFPYHLSHVLFHLPVWHPLSILRDDDNMVFTFPPHVGYTSLLMHTFFLLVLSWDLSGGRGHFLSPWIGRTYPGPPTRGGGFSDNQGRPPTYKTMKLMDLVQGMAS